MNYSLLKKFRDEGEDLARRFDLRFFRTSAKDNINIDEGKFRMEKNFTIKF